MLIYLAMIDSPEDQIKFIDIYNHYKDYLQYLAFDILHSVDDAEDAVQETFFYIAQNLNKIKNTSAPQTTAFLSLICEHKAIDIARLRLKRNEFEYSDVEYGIISHYSSENDLADAMLKLKAEDREVLYLRYYYGYTISEIGRLTLKSYGQTQRMILRAKEKLQAVLEDVD